MPKGRILIVEDETITAFHLQQELIQLGYEVIASVASGEEAVRVAEESHPELVLMDVKLDGSMDGLEASRKIRETRPIPILYLTAFPDVFLQAPTRMQRPGMCMSKPLSWSALESAIEIALGHSPDTHVSVLTPQ